MTCVNHGAVNSLQNNHNRCLNPEKENEFMENIYKDGREIERERKCRNDKAINLPKAISCGSRVFFHPLRKFFFWF
jgi:hypothetical protein